MVDINQLPEDFVLYEHQHPQVGVVFLILPKKSKQVWKPEELALRSLLCTPSGEIISAGFPKFFNHNEKDVSSFEAPYVVAEKMDGTLILRSVYQGQVLFRTRGNSILGNFEGPVMSLVAREYPKLLDPNWKPGVTALFEFTTPDPQLKIVVEYEKPQLTYLGDMDYPTFKSSPKQVAQVVLETGVSAPHFYTYPDFKTLVKEVVSFSQGEGVVVWGPQGQLVKVKALKYLELHALKFGISQKKMNFLYLLHNLDSKEKFEVFFKSQNPDWEASHMANQYYENTHRMVTSQKAILARWMQVLALVSVSGKERVFLLREKLTDFPEQTHSKLFAIGMKPDCQDLKDSFLFNLSKHQIKRVKELGKKGC